MRNKRSLLILGAMVLLLTLATMGVGYGLWSDELFINGVVETRHLETNWTFVGCYDIESKDVGTTTGLIDPDDPHTLYFTIENGYPSYTGGCEVEYTNVGTIPVHVEAINLLPGNLNNCTVDQSPTTGSFTATCDEVTITWANGLCTQLHEGDFLGSSLRLHVEQEAEQDWDYNFGVELQLNQFNESNCP